MPTFDMESLEEELLSNESGPYYKIEDQKLTRRATDSYPEPAASKRRITRSASISFVLPDSLQVQSQVTGRKVCVTKLDEQSVCSTRMTELSRASTLSFGCESQCMSRRNSIANLNDFDGMFSPTVSSPKEIQKAPRRKKEHRTTVMIKNIPCRYTQQDLFEEIQSLGFKLNFLYLPHASRSPKTLGYGFINLINAEDAARFLELMTGYVWKNQPNSVKTAQPIYANIQGLRKNVVFYSKRKGVKPKHRPWTLYKADADMA
jgi:hypothetical protein